MPWPPSVGASASRKTGYKWLGRYAQQYSPDCRASAPKRPNGKRKPFPPRSSERSWPCGRAIATWGEETQSALEPPTLTSIGRRCPLSGRCCFPPGSPTFPASAGATPRLPVRAHHAFAKAPNQAWATRFQGLGSKTGDGKRCDPLTISDTASDRYLLRKSKGRAQRHGARAAADGSDFPGVRPAHEDPFR